VGVYEDLMAAGTDLGVGRGGYYAIESMRLEKGYRAFGRELTPDYNPVEAGLLFACKLGTDVSFLGREAVEKARAEGPRRKLVSLVLDEPTAAPHAEPPTAEPRSAEPRSARGALWGGELVLRDGVAVGQVMSGAWGEALGAYVGLAYVRHPDGDVVTPAYLRSGSYQVNIGGDIRPATVHLRPPYDPAGTRVRGLAVNVIEC
ncbi:MAG: glycine cleavage T C-terminal barrel domain-containing protein, partial [Streptosporangiaceae bacterium]